jgi:uncharacterized protein (UPF0276 family)
VAGIGLRAPHHAEILRRRPPLDFVEVHSENFFAEGGPAPAALERFREAYALSLHGVGLSLGSADPLDRRHLARLASLVRRCDPLLVSEHLSWSSAGGRHAHELLPLPFTEEALAHVVDRIGAVQDALGRRILVENVSAYHAFPGAMPEWEFVAETARRSGCGLVLDVNNIWVNAVNLGFDAASYLAAIPAAAVGEIHLAGHEEIEGLLIDTHGARVSEPVWSLYADAVARFGPRPTLVEWDTDIPALDVLLEEAAHAGRIAHPAERAA